MESRNESEAVADYKRHSAVYNNLFRTVTSLKTIPPSHKHRLESLKNATTFSDMLQIANLYEIDSFPYWTNVSVNAFTTFSSLFSPRANFAYYCIRLRSDILNYKTEKSYHQQKKPSPTN